ncbi:MAG: LruC domain-containing protein [uncultured Thiotrichaceae bacterium]|uniref:LruC domain-containing protein n=1 Tax=uncultured Thiotrichaceae bacterium TaxID=298394 RepID=A0A6S6UHA7_9GAMM|nr:MAG: LruC domain-containing protein [uncultured Thiotrichaceae bacterium]
MRGLLLGGLLLCSPAALFAESFTDCPSRAFLTQGAVAKTYGVNLVTGDYNLIQDDMGTNNKLNAVGFNPNDGFLYAWSHEHDTAVKIHSDFTVEALAVSNITDNTFYVGDVELTTNKYYVYRPGSAYGLFSINLDEQADDYLKMVNVTDGDSMNLKIFDMAFHPSDGYAYAVDKKGDLHRIDVVAGTSEKLASIGGPTGTFGAAYFDVDENLYISRNNDGHIYKIDIGGQNYTAQLFAHGPSSSINDGSRCALAPVIDPDSDINIDFGDAPESYGTYLKDNGARHGLSDTNTLYLGSGVDGESDGKPLPLSDDEHDADGDGVDDEDGIQFATSLQAGDTAVLMITPSASGILSGWIDVDQNGIFDSDEQVITDKSVNAGKQPVFITVPDGEAKAGSTWARFRISSNSGLLPTGGAADGEVEDYKIDINVEGSSVTYYPSSSGWTTVVFEDNWPFEGDYDMNDLVSYLRTSIFRTDGDTTLINITGELAAVGASYHNGFGIRLPGILRDQIDEEAIEYKINNKPVTRFNPLEEGRNEAIFMITYNVWDYVSAGEDCIFYRTEAGCGSDIQMRFNLTIPFKQPVDTDIAGVFDPFLFATPDAPHGDHFATPPGRNYEIHLKNQEPTEAFDLSFMDGSGADGSVPNEGHYFQTVKGLPWAMEIGDHWHYPKEYRDVTHAYPLFPSYVMSKGEESAAWYTFDNAVESILFED